MDGEADEQNLQIEADAGASIARMGIAVDREVAAYGVECGYARRLNALCRTTEELGLRK